MARKFRIPTSRRLGKFNPDSEYIAKATGEYLNEGGEITKQEEVRYNTAAPPHRNEVYEFLLGKHETP